LETGELVGEEIRAGLKGPEMQRLRVEHGGILALAPDEWPTGGDEVSTTAR